MSVDKSEARVRQMFSDIAPRYDMLNHLLSANIDRRWREKTVRMVPPRGTAPILDVCTGTGDLALAYLAAADKRVEVVGADFAHPMLVRAAAKAKEAGYAERARFVEADAQRLPLADELFQIVSIAFGLRNVTSTERGLSEMVRVCRTGGRVVVLEFSQSRGPLHRLYQVYFRQVLPRVGRWLSPDKHDAYNYLPQSVEEFPCGEQLAELMRAAGLREVSFRPLLLGIATIYVGTK